MKRYVLLFLVFLLISQILCVTVTQQRADTIAENWLSYIKGSRSSISETITLDYEGHSSLYIVNFEGGGFVIVPADDAAIPVLGYSDKNQAVAEITHPAVQEWFEDYHKQIHAAIQLNESNAETLPLWNEIENGDFSRYPMSRGVGALCTTTWNQGQYYNEQCPVDATSSAGNGHVWAGCVATAMAQIMKYYNSPTAGYGSHSFTSTYGVESASFGSTSYDWTNMPNAVNSGSTTTQKNAVQSLIYHCAVAVDMDFGPSGSGAHSGSALKACVMYFNYDNGISYEEIGSDITAWKTMLKTEHNNSRPVLYCGTNGASSAHAFVCDGYNDSDYFHFNWGWGGVYNGYYQIGSLTPTGHDYSYENSALIGITPSTSSNTYPLFSSFDGYDDAGWNRDVDGDSTIDWGFYTYSPNSGVDCLGAKHTPKWLISPLITLPANTNNTFTIYTKRLNSFNQGLDVRVSTTGTNINTDFTTLLGNISVGSSWVQSTYDLSSYAGTTIYLGFKTTGTDDATYYYLFIDDLQIESTPVTNPTLSATDVPTGILYHRATTGGTISDDGGASLIQRGVCYAPWPAVPSSGVFVTASGTDVGSFTVTLTGLIAGMRYNVCSFAVNSFSLFGYGPVQDFTTDVYPPDGTSTQTVVEGVVTFPSTGLDIDFTGVAGSTTDDVTIDVIEEAPQSPGAAFLSATNPGAFSIVITNNTGFTFDTGQLQFNIVELDGIASGGINTSAFATMANGTDTGISLWHRSDYESGDFSFVSNLLYHDNNGINGDPDDYLYANVASFSEFTMSGGSEHTLPVELSSFTATITSEEAVKLDWVTQSENDMAGYNVLRSVTDSMDESAQLNLQIIPSQNATESTTYSYVDVDVVSDASYNYWLQGVNLDGSTRFYGPVSVTVQYTDPGEGDTPEVVLINNLEAAYPNPFNPATTIRFSVKKDETGSVRIYNLKGELIRSYDGYTSGEHKVVWDGADRSGKKVGSGIFLYRLETDSYTQTRKMMMIK